LLSDGRVHCEEARVNIVIWFDKGKIPGTINLGEPFSDWLWEEKMIACAGADQGQMTLRIGSGVIDAQDEIQLSRWYLETAPTVSQAGGRLYVDERIAEGMDISAFLSSADAVPRQWDMEGKTCSVAAWREEAGSGLWAGQDKINMQLATRFSEQGGQTVLAYPVLMEEF
jgi:hypothetical protein